MEFAEKIGLSRDKVMSYTLQIRRFTTFFRRFVEHAPQRVLLDFGLMLGLGFVQGIGILMLIPLLSYVGLTDASRDGPVASIAAFFFEGVGLPQSLPVILVLYTTLVGTLAFLSRRQSVLNMELQLGFIRRLRHDVYAAIVRADWRFVVASRQAALTQVLTHDVQRAGQAVFYLMRGAAATVMLAVYFAISLRLSLPLTLLTCGTAGVLVFLLGGTFRSARRSGKDQTRYANRLYAAVTEHLSGLKEIRSYGAEARSLAYFDSVNETLDGIRLRFHRHHTAAGMWMNAGTVALLSVLLFVSVEALHLPLASLLLLIYLFARMLPLATQLQQMTMNLLNALPAFEAVERLLHRARAAAEPQGPDEPLPFRRDIRFEDVSFRYREDRPILENVTLRIEANRTTALVGASGAGKSTVANLLMGLLSPGAGRILVDGHVLAPERVAAWRRGIGYVPQETYLFHDTVRANLLWARPESTDAELWEALELAAAGFVRDLPGGLDAVLGDRGVRLSGGERQRLALARALLRRPALLVLDEATSALDLENEQRVFEAIRRLHGRVTVVIVTHRLASIEAVDHVVLLDAGRVVDAGTWPELRARGTAPFAAERQEVGTPLAGHDLLPSAKR